MRSLKDSSDAATLGESNPFARFALGSSLLLSRDNDSVTPHDPPVHVTPDIITTKVKRPRLDTGGRAILDYSLSVDSRLAALHQLREFRQDGSAPVDKFGTDQVVDSRAPPKSQRLHALLGAMLSTQTKDEITAAAMRRLHNATKPDGGLSISSLQKLPLDKLADLLAPVGFYTKKAAHIKIIVDMLHAKYEDDVPSSLTELTNLPGIGPKVARLTLLVAWGIVDGIIVDTHVQRIAKRLGWTRLRTNSTTNSETTRRDLEEWVPRHLWRNMSKMMIGFGQLTCTAVRPKCDKCPLTASCQLQMEQRPLGKAATVEEHTN